MEVRRWVRPALGVGAIGLFGIALALHGLGGSPAAAAVGSFAEFAIPSANAVPEGIAAGPDGNVWFAEFAGGSGTQIGRITPTGSVTEFGGLSAGSGPFWITAGPDKNLWFTESSGNGIGRITTSGIVTEFTVPTANSGPNQIAIGPDGNLWFTEYVTDTVANISTTGSITEVTHLTAGRGPSGIVAGPDGNLWFDEQKADRIGMITPAGVATEFALAAGSTPSSITKGPDGKLWFTEFGTNKIGTITTAGVVTEYAVPTAGSQPGTIAAGPDGNLWFSEQNANKIGRITPAGSITEFGPIPTAASGPGGITAGSDGNLWFTQRLGNNIGRLALAAPATCDNVWTGMGGDSNFSNALNWSAGHDPTSAENTCIDATTTTFPKAVADSYTVVVSSNVTVGSLILGGLTGQQTLDVSSGGISFGINGDSTINVNGVLNVGDAGSSFSLLNGNGHTLTNTGHINTLAGSGGDTSRYLRVDMVNTAGGTVDLAGATVQDGVGGGTVTTNNGSVSVASTGSLAVGGGSVFRNNGGSVTNHGTFSVAGAAFIERGGSENGNPVGIGGGGTLDDDRSAASSIFTMGNNSTLTGTGLSPGIAGGQAVSLVTGNSTIGLGADLTNQGTLIVGDAGAGFTVLAGNGHSLFNIGHLDTVLGSSGDTNRYLRLNLTNGAGATFDLAAGTVQDGAGGATTTTNFGAITVEATGSLAISGASEFKNLGGSVTNAGSFTVNGGGSTFLERSGTETGNPVGIGDQGFLDSDLSGSSSRFNLGNNSILTGTGPNPGIAAGQVVTLAAGNATIGLGRGVTNAGTLILGDGSPGYCVLRGNANSLINTGHLNTTLGTGPGDPNRYLRLSVTNNGSMDLAGTTVQDGVGGATSATNNGSVTVESSGSLVIGGSSVFINAGGSVTNGGTFSVGGGSRFSQLHGTVTINPVRIGDGGILDDDMSSGTALFTMGNNSILTGSGLNPGIAAGQVVTLAAGNATIGLGTGVTNAGTLILGDGSPGYSLLAGNGNRLINTGLLETTLGTGPGDPNRYLRLSMTNTGSMDFAGGTVQDGVGETTTTTNTGAITVEATGNVALSGGAGFVNAAGSVINHGSFSLGGGSRFTQRNGTVSINPVLIGNGDFLDDDLSAAAALFIMGNNSTLTGSGPNPGIAAGQVVTLVAGNATIGLGTGVTNAGTLILGDGSPGYSLLVGNGNRLINTGLLKTTLGTSPGDPNRYLRLSVTNSGSMDFAGGTVQDGVGETTTTANDGTLTIETTGTLLLGGGSTFAQSAAGTFAPTIDANTSAFGRLVGGGVTLAGTLRVSTIGSPAVGSSWPIISGAALSGIFAIDDFGATNYATHYSLSGLTLVVQPPPVDPSISATGSPVTANEGSPVAGAVATFADPDVTAPASEYSATITWGDGTTDVGTITGGGGNFVVSGTHTYAEEGSFALSITVSDSDTASNASTASATATVADAALSATGATITATEGSLTGSVLVATFSDADPGALPTDYSVTITWGDNTSSSGTVTGTGPFTVTGNHIYTEEGTFPVVVGIADSGSGVVANGSAAVSDPPVAATGGVTVTASEGTLSSIQPVATFVDPGGPEVVANYAAAINWGDATSSAGTITMNPGTDVYSVSGAHRYAEEGTYALSVTILHESSGPAVVVSGAVVADPAVVVTPGAVSGVEGSNTGPVAVATFTDPGGPELLGDYAASIAWGDGATSSATVTFDATSQTFRVTGNHAYMEEGSNAAVVTVTHDSASAAVANLTATIADAPLTATGATINAVEGLSSGSASVATFSDADPSGTASDYTATINWGDGTTTTGTTAGTGPFTVTGSHTYAEEGTYATTVVIGDSGGSSTTVSGSAIVSDPAVLATGGTLTATEGMVSTSQAVATFTDPGGPEVPANYVATINWGDGTTSAGTVTFDSSKGIFTVTGAHLYAEEGSRSFSVSIDHESTITIVSSSASVADPAAVLTPVVVSGVEGTGTGSLTVATFTDPGGAEPVADYGASIAWGDGTTTAGTITFDATSKGFSVTGNHTYSEEGSSPITVTVTHDSAPSTTGQQTARVADAALTATGVAINSVEGLASGSVTVAAFSDADPAGMASDYTATITWGDGSTTQGTILGTGLFSVSGNHTYAEEGAHPTSVVISDTGGSSSTAAGSASVADPTVLATGGFTVTATEGATSTSQTVATFTDPGGAEPLANYAATIDWGDGTTSAGSTTLNNATGVYSVSGSHAYTEEGARPLAVTILHQTSSPALVSGSAIVADPAVVLTPVGVSGVEGTDTGTMRVATFTDPGGAEVIGDYGATISWGDGTTTAGTITFDVNSQLFDVTGHHPYGEEGGYPITVTLNHDSAPGSTGQQTATVTDAALTASASSIGATEGSQFSGSVASFSDADPGGVPSDYTATIIWGDGTTTLGTVTGTGPFSVTGTHTYGEEGTYPVSVMVADGGGSSAMGSSLASVSDPSVIATGGFTVIATEGAMSTTQAVASFVDPGGAESVADYAATIGWGDGTTSAGTITLDSTTGIYAVIGAHQFAQEGTYTLTIAISHEAAALYAVASIANVADPAVVLRPFPLSGVEGVDTGSLLVTSFTDPGGPEVAADYGASIAWGDGTTTPGAIGFDAASGTFSVTGHHTYAEEGSYTVGVAASHDRAPTATSQQTATVADAALAATGTAVTGIEGAPFSGKVATFTDANPGALASDFTVMIDWGDGTSTSPGTVASNGAGFDVNASHHYAEEGASVITVGIADVGGSTAVATTSATIADAALTATGTTFTVQRKTTFTQVVASFTDADPGGTALDYSAIIDWGDGTSSAGTIGPNNAGGFDVTGTHRYKKKGSKTVVVTIADTGGSTATAQSTIKVVNKEDEDDEGDDDRREGGNLE